jgi:four helix bundle protein
MTWKRFEELEAWQEARKLAKQVYTITRSAPFNEDWDLRRQLRKSSTSSMGNTAEGFDSGTNAEFTRFLFIARRSAGETQSHLYAALDQSYIDKSIFEELYDLARRVKVLIDGLIKYLRKSPQRLRFP